MTPSRNCSPFESHNSAGKVIPFLHSHVQLSFSSGEHRRFKLRFQSLVTWARMAQPVQWLGYQLDDPRNWGSIPGEEQEIFSSAKLPDRLLGHQPILSLGAKRLGNGVLLPLTHMPSRCCASLSTGLCHSYEIKQVKQRYTSLVFVANAGWLNIKI